MPLLSPHFPKSVLGTVLLGLLALHCKKGKNTCKFDKSQVSLNVSQ